MIGQVAQVHRPGLVSQQAFDRATLLAQGLQETEDPDKAIPADVCLGVAKIGAQLGL